MGCCCAMALAVHSSCRRLQSRGTGRELFLSAEGLVLLDVYPDFDGEYELESFGDLSPSRRGAFCC